MMSSRLVFWYLVLALLSESSAYSNSEEACELVRFTLNMEESNRVPKLILLQWTPLIDQEVRLSARGGCANASTHYKWFSSDSRIVSVTPYGIIRAKMPGVATVKVVSTCEPQNYDLIVVKVFAVQRMCYEMDDMKANADSIYMKPGYFFKLTLIISMFPLAIYIGHLILVYFSANPHIEPSSSTSHSDLQCHRTKRLRRPTTALATIVVEKKMYRRRWFFRP